MISSSCSEAVLYGYSDFCDDTKCYFIQLLVICTFLSVSRATFESRTAHVFNRLISAELYLLREETFYL